MSKRIGASTADGRVVTASLGAHIFRDRIVKVLRLCLGLLLLGAVLSLDGAPVLASSGNGAVNPSPALGPTAVPLVTFSPRAQATNSTAQVKLSISPEVPWVRRGETFTFAIYADPGEAGISAAEVILHYRRGLELLEVKPGPFLGDATITGLARIDADKRVATFAWARIGETPVPTPSGVLALVTMKADPKASYWYTRFNVRARFADQKLQRTQESFLRRVRIHLYRQLPRPQYQSPTRGSRTGPIPTFSLRASAPATYRYRIELSQDGFQNVFRTYDQTVSQEGWDKEQYKRREIAEFTPPEPLEPGEYQWRAAAWVEGMGAWGEPAQPPQVFLVMPTDVGIESLVSNMRGPGGLLLDLRGWGFSGSSVRLIGPDGQAHEPSQVTLQTGEFLRAVFDLGDYQPGLWGVDIMPRQGDSAKDELVIFPHMPAIEVTFQGRALVPGRGITHYIQAVNRGTADGVGVVAIRWPKGIELTRVGHRAQILVQQEQLIIFSTGQLRRQVIGRYGRPAPFTSRVALVFRLSPEQIAWEVEERCRQVPNPLQCRQVNRWGFPDRFLIGDRVRFDSVLVGAVTWDEWQSLKGQPVASVLEQSFLLNRKREVQLLKMASTLVESQQTALQEEIDTLVNYQEFKEVLKSLLGIELP